MLAYGGDWGAILFQPLCHCYWQSMFYFLHLRCRYLIFRVRSLFGTERLLCEHSLLPNRPNSTFLELHRGQRGLKVRIHGMLPLFAACCRQLPDQNLIAGNRPSLVFPTAWFTAADSLNERKNTVTLRFI